MEKTRFVGKGWEGKYGDINISIESEKLSALTPNEHGNIFLKVVKRKEPDPKSKATHFVCVNEYYHGEKEETPF